MNLPAPMLLQEHAGPPSFSEDWIWEIKFDGYRMLAGVNNGQVQLATKSGAPAAHWFPEVARGLAELGGGPHALDGEVCVLDDLGRSDFDRLHVRARRRKFYEGCDPVVYCAFDVLTVDGRSVISLPIEERKQLLEDLLTPLPPSVLLVGGFTAGEARQVFAHAKALNIEGLVAKRRGSAYWPGQRSPDWLKLKRPGAVPPQRFARK